ncbi:PDGF- and VEGF-related factor 1 [Xylocopa sonorina]|uniref:PDGF- and VEGF-related factor 1 n=1 Tax=Xylocopa sonorina TaxID=1818115 RepID=UPI00403A8FE1
MSHLVRSGTFLLVMVCGLFAAAQKNTQYHGDPDGIVFPGPIQRRTSVPATQPTRKLRGSIEVSNTMELAKKIDSANSVQEFLALVENVPPSEQDFFLASRIGERSNAEEPTPAKCMPELQTVSLEQDNDPSIAYYPSCTRVKRCGGCCGSKLHSCQPLTTEIRNFVVVTIDISGIRMKYIDKRIVPVEEHTSCQCDCKIKEEHCNAKQEYYPNECTCECKNVDEARKCNASSDIKIWDSKQCACSCRDVLDCSTGFYFDKTTCRCEQNE